MKEIFKLIKSDYKRYSGNSNIFYGGGDMGCLIGKKRVFCLYLLATACIIKEHNNQTLCKTDAQKII